MWEVQGCMHPLRSGHHFPRSDIVGVWFPRFIVTFLAIFNGSLRGAGSEDWPGWGKALRKCHI